MHSKPIKFNLLQALTCSFSAKRVSVGSLVSFDKADSWALFMNNIMQLHIAAAATIALWLAISTPLCSVSKQNVWCHKYKLYANIGPRNKDTARAIVTAIPSIVSLVLISYGIFWSINITNLYNLCHEEVYLCIVYANQAHIDCYFDVSIAVPLSLLLSSCGSHVQQSGCCWRGCQK